jgi:hypothetical protein
LGGGEDFGVGGGEEVIRDQRPGIRSERLWSLVESLAGYGVTQSSQRTAEDAESLGDRPGVWKISYIEVLRPSLSDGLGMTRSITPCCHASTN